MGEYGIDVASYQGRIDWHRVKASGVHVAISKATEGRTFVDPTFTRNRDGMREAGIPVRGAYHFARPQNSAEADASHFLAVAKSADLLPALDAEPAPSGWPLAPGEQSIRWCERWCEIVQAAHRTPILYTGRSFWQTHLRESPRLWRRFPLWVAEYGSSRPRTSTPYAMWQYSSSGSVPGISGRVDVNRKGSVPLPGGGGGSGGFLMALSDDEQERMKNEVTRSYGWLKAMNEGTGSPYNLASVWTQLANLADRLTVIYEHVAREAPDSLHDPFGVPPMRGDLLRAIAAGGGGGGDGTTPATPGELRDALVAFRDSLDAAISTIPEGA